MLKKHTLVLTHTHSQLPSPQEALLDLCSSLEITGPSLLTLPPAEQETRAFQRNIRPVNGFALSPSSHYDAASSVHYLRWLSAPPQSEGRVAGVGGARARQAPARDDADGAEGGGKRGGRESV